MRRQLISSFNFSIFQLFTLIFPTFGQQIGHLAANYPAFVVETLIFYDAEMFAK